MRTLRTILTIAVATVALAIAGCNTIKGIGTDIHDTAQNAQDVLEGNYAYQ